MNNQVGNRSKLKTYDGVSPIVIYDGECILCDRSVHFLLRTMKSDPFFFTTLSGDTMQQILTENTSISSLDELPDSILFFEEGQLYVESTAALRICKYLKRPYSWLRFFLIVPTFLRNVVYRFVARNRYDWFGKKASGFVKVSDDVEARFLD